MEYGAQAKMFPVCYNSGQPTAKGAAMIAKTGRTAFIVLLGIFLGATPGPAACRISGATNG